MPPAANSAASAPPAEQRVVGRPFQPGQSGNPSGRPKGVASAARELIKDDPAALLKVLLAVARNTKAKPGDRIAATREYLDRAYGKAPAFAPIDGENPLELGSVERRLAALLDELADRREARAARGGSPPALAGDGTARATAA